MGTVIGDVLPLAIGVAISPIPIIAVTLMLLSSHAGRTSVGFLAGWIAGIVSITVVVQLLVAGAESDTSGESTLSSVLKLVFGVLLLLLAARQWRKRPHEGQSAQMPKWMSTINTLSGWAACGLGLLLSAANPKNLLMCFSAGTTIAAGSLSTGETVTATAIFAALAVSTVAAPVVIFLASREKVQHQLGELRVWLTDHNVAVMSVLLLVIGVVLIGKGLSGLTSAAAEGAPPTS